MGSFRRRMARGPGGVLDRLPTKANRRTAAGLARLDRVVTDLVAAHRAAETGRPDGAVGDDVLSMLVAARDEDGDGSGMSDRQIRDEVMTLVLAGHETTANALTWAWFLLGRDASARERLQAEVDGLGAEPRTEDVSRLPWVRAVVAETLRLYPPAWTIGRRLTEDVTVDELDASGGLAHRGQSMGRSTATRGGGATRRPSGRTAGLTPPAPSTRAPPVSHEGRGSRSVWVGGSASGSPSRGPRPYSCWPRWPVGGR